MKNSERNVVEVREWSTPEGEASDVRAESKAIRPVASSICQYEGHDFDVLVVEMSGQPRQIYCSRCGKTWKVTESDD